MKKIILAGLLLTSGLGLSACGTPSKSYIDGWNARVDQNNGDAGVYGYGCEYIYHSGYNNVNGDPYGGFPNDIHSDFISGCKAAGYSTQTWGQSH